MGSKINERMITENPIDLLSVAELKKELKSYGLSLSGTKKELRARLFFKSGRKYEGIKKKPRLRIIVPVDEPKADMKKAVALLLESYWFGWDDGKPHIFDKMFDKYGTFLPSVGKASSMVGTPDTHTSEINIGAKAEGQMVKMVLKNEGKVGLQRVLSTSPALQEAFKDMTIEQIVRLIENDGKKFEFRKIADGDYYKYWLPRRSHPSAHNQIPRWAIG